MRSKKISIAIHILSLIELLPEVEVNSTIVAQSIKTNPVVIRRIMTELKKADIIVATPNNKGVKVAIDIKTLTLYDLYAILEGRKKVLNSHHKGQVTCPVGCCFDQIMDKHFGEVQKEYEKILASKYVYDVIQDVKSEMENNESIKQCN